MNGRSSIAKDWICEKWENVEIRYRPKEILQDLKTNFQHLMLVDTFQYGKMLILDGIVQTTEKDEFIYHEMMAHVPLFSHPNPRKVLIIGGGDGGVLREVLKHESVEEATLVEIDAKVIDFCKSHLPTISNGAFDDKRATIINADGGEFVKKTNNSYDIVIVDSPDPIGPAQVLFSAEFYQDIHRIMKPDGIMVRQTGSTQMQRDEQEQAYRILKNIFQYNAFYLYSVPTYIGGFFSSLFSSDSIDPIGKKHENKSKEDLIKFQTKYYNEKIHSGAFDLPPFMEDICCDAFQRE
ncbi:MAG: polyamine aminopropyltransferase [Desulfatiglans sp.]|jgi:spermidine synthase|nr:polyamine aminopropyltransferase [Thermodesulfobacteriota bacterium]MEE4354221.1 polyamine aminopropyltransferase [Desulfatiglans sp.]